MPLAPERLAARGYNQAGLLARTYAELRGLRVAPRGAARVRQTESQVGLSAKQRRLNVAGAFAGETTIVAGKTIILIDDVCTTGATLDVVRRGTISRGSRPGLGADPGPGALAGLKTDRLVDADREAGAGFRAEKYGKLLPNETEGGGFNGGLRTDPLT